MCLCFKAVTTFHLFTGENEAFIVKERVDWLLSFMTSLGSPIVVRGSVRACAPENRLRGEELQLLRRNSEVLPPCSAAAARFG